MIKWLLDLFNPLPKQKKNDYDQGYATIQRMLITTPEDIVIRYITIKDHDAESQYQKGMLQALEDWRKLQRSLINVP